MKISALVILHWVYLLARNHRGHVKFVDFESEISVISQVRDTSLTSLVHRCN